MSIIERLARTLELIELSLLLKVGPRVRAAALIIVLLAPTIYRIIFTGALSARSVPDMLAIFIGGHDIPSFLIFLIYGIIQVLLVDYRTNRSPLAHHFNWYGRPIGRKPVCS